MRDRSHPNAWSVYLLRCVDGTLYCGATNDVTRRLAAHARGRVKYTRGRLPVELAHLEAAADRSDALRREAAWKRLPRAEKLRRLRSPRACVPAADSVSARHVENRAPRPRAPRPRLR
jgi:putative endonuclease